MDDKIPGLERQLSVRKVLCGERTYTMLKTPPLTSPAPTLKRDRRPTRVKIKHPHLSTQIARRDLTATSVQTKEKTRMSVPKVRNSTLLNRCFLVKQYIPLGR